MKMGIKLAVVCITGLAIVTGLGLRAEQGPSGGGTPKGFVATDIQLLVAHALGMAIDGTSAHLTARSIATLSDRKPDEAQATLEAMRKAARSTYQDSTKLLREAQQRLAGAPGDATGRQLYEAAIAYTKTMWQLTGEATPVTEEKEETKPAGELGIDDLATLESINQTVRAAIEAFQLKQLTLRSPSSGSDAMHTLDDHAGSMAKASKKASASFPQIPEELKAEAESKLQAAKSIKSAAKQEKEASKKVEKTAKRLQSRELTKVANETKEAAKQAKKQAGKQEKEAKKAKQKAEKAQKNEIGEDVRPSVQKLGRQGRAIVLLLDQMIEGPESAQDKKSQK